MAIRTVYVGGGNGSAVTSPGAGSYANLTAAELAERANLVSTTTELVIVLEDGTYTETAAVNFTSANWTTDATYSITIQGDTAFGALVRITTDTYSDVITIGAGVDHVTLEDFIIDHQGPSASSANRGLTISSGSEGSVAQRMFLKGQSPGRVGGSSSGVGIVKNSVCIGYVAGINVFSYGTISHCTCISLGSSGGGIDCQNATGTSVEHSYAYCSGTPDDLDESTATFATQTNVHTADSSGDTGSVAYSTANFTNVTAGTEDFSLPVGSALIGAASGSTETEDIRGRTRSDPEDVGAYERTGEVYINDAATLDGGEVLQTYPSSWSDTSLTMPDAPVTTGLSGQLYVIVENADGSIGSRAVTVGSASIDYPILVPTGPIR